MKTLLPAIMGAVLLLGHGERTALGGQAGRDEAQMIQRLEELIGSQVKAGGLTGVSVALVRDGKIIYTKGFGLSDKARKLPTTAQTTYRAGSVSKLFTAIAVMQQVEAGRLDLDKPVGEYDPNFSIVNPFLDAKPVTLRDLLAHRAGLIRESPVGSYFDDTQPTPQASVRSIHPCVLVYRPGTRTKYSNIGVTVAGEAVRLVSGMEFHNYQQSRLLGPMGMNDSSFAISDSIRKRLAVGYMLVADGHGGFREIQAPLFEFGTIPAANLYATAQDLGRFLVCIMSQGRTRTEPILKPETLQEMFKIQGQEAKEGFGLGFFVSRLRDNLIVSHTGAVYGFTSSVTALPEKGLGVVVLANDDIAMGPVKMIADAAMSSLLDGSFPATPPAVPLEDPQPFTGDYESQSYWARIEAGEGGLKADISGQQFRLQPFGPGQFLAYGRHASASPVAFERDPTGNVQAFTALGQKFQRVNPATAAPPPSEWQALLGAYGPDFIPLWITMRHGHLYAMTENMFDYRLTPASGMVFRCPPGLYEGEELVFQAGPDGKVHTAILANMPLRRLAPPPAPKGP